MAFVSIVQLFSTTPLDGGDTSGYPAGTKAHGFGEVITSARLNRLGYALALNDEDINARLIAQTFKENLEVGELDTRVTTLTTNLLDLTARVDPFDTDGLDAAYRLGATNDAGGGRGILVNGGPVELFPAYSGLSNINWAGTALRLNITGSGISEGDVGLDIVSHAAGPVTGKYGIIERYPFNGTGVTSIAETSPVILNPGGGQSDSLVFGAAGDDTGHPNSEIHAGFDLISIFGGSAPGLYIIKTIVDSTTVLVRALTDDAIPSFVQDESTFAKVYRPRLMTGGVFGVLLQEDPYQQFSALRIHSSARNAIEVYSGFGGLSLNFSVSPSGNVTASGGVTSTSYSLDTPRSQTSIAMVTDLWTGDSSDVISRVSHGYGVNPNGPSFTLRAYLHIDAPEGAILQALRFNLGVVGSAVNATLDTVSLRQITYGKSTVAHGQPGVVPVNTLIKTGASFVLSVLSSPKTVTLDSLATTHPRDAVYLLEMSFSFVDASAVVEFYVPSITYTYDVL